MEYFLSHIGVIFCGAAFVAFCAVLWWYSLMLAEKRKRERAEARRIEIERRRSQKNN